MPNCNYVQHSATHQINGKLNTFQRRRGGFVVPVQFRSKKKIFFGDFERRACALKVNKKNELDIETGGDVYK